MKKQRIKVLFVLTSLMGIVCIGTLAYQQLFKTGFALFGFLL